jgi:hypothetical protein
MDEIDSSKLGECLFAMLKEHPDLLTDDRLTADATPYELAAQSAMLSFAKKELADLSALPKPVRILIAMFIGQFAKDLTGPLSRERWHVPRGIPMPDQARFVIAGLLQENSSRQPMQH